MPIKLNEASAVGSASMPSPEAGPGPEPRRFPSGTKALWKLVDGKRAPLSDSDPVTLVNVSLARVFIRTRDDTMRPKAGEVEKVVEIGPFAKATLPCVHARRALLAQEKRGANPQLVVAPVDGDCGGKMSFEAYGKRYVTCPYAACKTCGPLPPNVHWSVWQVQHRIKMLGTEPAIRRVVERVDSRPAVVMWGLEIIGQRLKARQERLGIAQQSDVANVTF